MKNQMFWARKLLCGWEVVTSKEMPIVPAGKVVDKKRIAWKRGGGGGEAQGVAAFPKVINPNMVKNSLPMHFG
jgi:hypothetical protein